MEPKLLLPIVLAASLLSLELSGASATEIKAQGKNISDVTPAGQCGTWVKEPDWGYFTSPNYPQKYPPEKECVYIIEASPRQCIDLFFDDKYSIEPSWECKFDHIEVRDGPFGFSPILGRFCGEDSPASVRSSGRYLYIKFVADGELEAIGFSARYNFTQDPEFKGLGELPPLPFCEFEMSGPEGYVESVQITGEGRALPTEAVDCRWYIKAPPKSRIYMRFLEYEMHNSNECKRNFVAIYDGSSSVEHLKNKFCSTVANDVMLVSSVGVVRLWADEGSRKSKFRILFTTFHEPPCGAETFFCHSNMCINQTLVCNGIQNCVYPWDENHCKEKRKASILDTLDNTNITIITVTCGLVVILLVISVIIQVKQPRKKYIIRRDDFDPALLHPGLEPPHYELCTLRRDPSGDLTDAAMAEDYEKLHKLRRSSSKCIRDHHCGSFQGSVHGSRSNLSLRDATIAAEPQAMVGQQSPGLPQHAAPTGRRSVLQPAAEKRSGSRVGLVVTGVLGGSLVALYAVAAPFLAPALRKVCLPFVPATTAQVENVLGALRARSGTLVDIGSGDGRIVIAAAKRGFQASGFELNPWLVWYSRYKAIREGVHRSASFHISDLWKVSFAEYSNVVIFGVPQMMDQLELKLACELPSAAQVVACRFPFPTWVPERTVGEGIDTVWVYDAKTFTSRSQHGTAGKTTPEHDNKLDAHA